MKRRHFIKALSLAGMTAFTPLALNMRGKTVHAAEGQDYDPYPGPYWIMINCLGGWDVTQFCDPKGTAVSIGDGDKGPVNWHYGADEIVNMGTAAKPLRVAPDKIINSTDELVAGDYYGDFLTRYKDRITFVNGVDNGTNGHTQGERVTWSGVLKPGYPSLAALIAAEQMRPYELPIPFLTFGGYDKTAELVLPTRLQNMAAFTKVVAPDVARFDGLEPKTFHDSFADEAIRRASDARLESLRNNAQLPRFKKGLDALFTSRLTEGNIERVMNYLDLGYLNGLSSSRMDNLRKQAHVSLSTFEAGVSVSANLAVGGWDTHRDSIDRASQRYVELFTLLDELRLEAEMRGIGDKLHIFVGSDFGRTPYKNATEGKDHWAVGSWMHVSANPSGGRGTIGGTDANMRARRILDDGTLAQNEGDGLLVTPSVLHNDIRKLAGIDQSEYAKSYPMEPGQEASFSLFG